MHRNCSACSAFEKSEPCPVLKLLNVFERKWAARIIKQLYVHSMSFNELRRAIPGVTQGMLSERLQNLQESGLIKRKILNTKPLAVEYSLAKYTKKILSCWDKL